MSVPTWKLESEKALAEYKVVVEDKEYCNVPRELERAIDTLIEVSELEPKVRSNCTVSATVVWAGLGEHPLNKVFGSPGVVRPEMILDGKIICVNLPLGTSGASKVAFVLWKLAVQKMLMARAPQ